MGRIGRRRFLLLAAGAAGSAAALWRGADRRCPRFTRTTSALGAEVSLTVRHPRPDVAERAISAAFGELQLVQRLMSIYDRESQLSRLNRNGELAAPHPHLVAVLREAQRMSATSNGAFDVTVQPLWEAFAAAQKQNRLPMDSEVAAARAAVDWRQVEVTDDRVRFLRPGMQITLNGIAQGYASDRVLLALREHGIEHALINAGELNSLGQTDRGGPWRVGIQHPRRAEAYVALADLDGRALATSGDYNTKFSADGHLNHIFDPRSGCSPTELASASVVAPTATLADALSTALFVLGSNEGLALLARHAGAGALLVTKDGETITTADFPLCDEGVGEEGSAG